MKLLHALGLGLLLAVIVGCVIASTVYILAPYVS